MVGQASSQSLRYLKYLLNQFEQHNINKLAQLNQQLLMQSELQIRLAAADKLLKVLNCKLLVALRDGGANTASLS